MITLPGDQQIRRFYTAIILFSLFFAPRLLAQSVTIKGRLIDRQTKETLPYSTIYVPSRKTGTVSNGEGRFTLHLSQPTDADSLVLSSVGYRSVRLPLKSLLSQSDEQTIALQPAVEQLREVVVRPIDPVELVQQVMRRVTKNHPVKPAVLTGFYREWVREAAYVVFSEGQLELYKASYKRTAQDDAVRMLKGRRKPLPNYFLSGKDTCHLPDITNGPHLGILLDVVKNPELSNFLSAEAPDLYDYQYTGQTSVNDRSAYIIDFAPKSTSVAGRGNYIRGIFAGTLLIDTQSLALVKADYTLSAVGLSYANLSLNALKIPTRLDHRRYVVSYQPFNDRYVLSHAQVENDYTYKPRRAQPIRNRMDFVVTKTDFDEVKKFDKKDIISASQTFSEQIMSFDDTFWENETIIVDEP